MRFRLAPGWTTFPSCVYTASICTSSLWVARVFSCFLMSLQRSFVAPTPSPLYPGGSCRSNVWSLCVLSRCIPLAASPWHETVAGGGGGFRTTLYVTASADAFPRDRLARNLDWIFRSRGKRHVREYHRHISLRVSTLKEKKLVPPPINFCVSWLSIGGGWGGGGTLARGRGPKIAFFGSIPCGM